MKMYLLASICSIFVVAPILGVVVVCGGFLTYKAYSIYFGGALDGQEWIYAIVPIYLLIVSGFLSILGPSVLGFLTLTRKVSWAITWYLALCVTSLAIMMTAGVLFELNPPIVPLRKVMSSSMETYYRHGQLETARTISTQFWDNLQINLNCCGIGGPSDWVSASGAPTIGFVPNSCCLNHSNDDETCTSGITRENVNDFGFLSQFVYTKGCYWEFSHFSIPILLLLTTTMLSFQICGLVCHRHAER